MSKRIKGDQDFFFIERTVFDRTFEELNNKKAPRLRISWIISTIGTLIITILTTDKYISILGIPPCIIKKTIFIVIIILFLLLICFIIAKCSFKSKGKWENLTIDIVKGELIKNSDELNEYNILLLIPNFSEKGISLLASKKTQWQNAIFLPYISYDTKEDFSSLDSLNERIQEFLATDIKFKYEYLANMDIFNEIKYHKDSHLRRYNYKFVLVYPKSNFLMNIFNQNIQTKYGCEFFPIEKMKNDIYTMLRNAEVISKIEENTVYLKEIFSNLNRKTNRLIWNISEKCNEKCEFCAFGNSGKVEFQQIADINKIVSELSKIKIDKIDISTGNSVDIAYLKKCIVEFKKAGYKVGLTATSKIISVLDPDFITENLSMIEFSYDSLDPIQHRSDNFNESNYLSIKNLKKIIKNNKVIKFNVLMVLYTHLSFKLFERTIKKLHRIGIASITLIRLMPVGYMSEKQYPQKLQNKKFYNVYLDYCKNESEVTPHCSFDGILSDVKYCNKGITKISMSPSGDIYSCPWGEHLLDSNNLFFLGNIFDGDIIERINEQNFGNMESKFFSCEIFNTKYGEDFLYK